VNSDGQQRQVRQNAEAGADARVFLLELPDGGSAVFDIIR
jgi:hypothetical protein